MNTAIWVRKILGDARQNWLQMGLVALVLSIGTCGVVAALNARAILKGEIDRNFVAARTPDIALFYERVTPQLLALAAAQPGVAAVDARRVVTTRVQVADETWLPMQLTIAQDLSNQQVGVRHLHDGHWAAQDGAIWIEQSGKSMLEAAVGGTLKLRTASGAIASMRVAGYAHDTAVAPSFQERVIYGYINSDSANLLGQSPLSDQLVVKLKQRGPDAAAQEFGEALNTQLRRSGQTAQRVEVLPDAHPHHELMQAVLSVLGVLSVLASLCSAALAGYMVTAWMRRETRQVGVLKALGAQSLQIARQNLCLVTPLALLAAVVGMALGTALAHTIVREYANTLNIDIALWAVPTALFWKEIALAVLVPILAMALPIARAARMTALSAIQDVGITAPIKMGRWTALLLRFPGSVTWTLALRNTWRRPWRLTLIVLALASGGTLLLTIHSHYESLVSIVDTRLAEQGHDIEVLMQDPAPAQRLEAVARSVPEVATAEAWYRASVSTAPGLFAETGAKPAQFALSAYPVGSKLFKLPVVEGRAPQEGAKDEVLVTKRLLVKHPALELGAKVPLEVNERRSTVHVVGVVEEVATALMYTNVATFEAVATLGLGASALRVKTNSPDLALVAGALDQAFLRVDLVPSQVAPRTVFREMLAEHIKVAGDVLRVVALAAALLGAIVLGATTALNVLERRREVGVLRALGARPVRIAMLFLVEAGTVTLACTVLSIALALLLTRTLLNVAERMVSVSVPMQFSWTGMGVLCCGTLVVLLMVALPLSVALRKSVRETLSYE